MQKIHFYLSDKYLNYKKILKMVNQKCDLNNDLGYLSLRLKTHYKDFLEIKENIINKYNDLDIMEYVDEDKFKLTIQSLRNVSKVCENDKFVIGKNENGQNKILNKEIELLIKDIEKDFFKNKQINIDLILNVFRLVDFEKELKENPKSIYKLHSLFLNKNENLKDMMEIRIYGQNFEQLNKIFLKNVFDKDLNVINDLDTWNYLSKKHQYNLYTQKCIEKNEKHLSWESFLYGDKKVEHKFRVNIPSLDLEVKINNTQYYIETKNYTENDKNDFSISLNHNSEKILNRLNVQSILEKDNCKILYNINLYNDKNFYSFLIPIHELKKFYQQIDKQVNLYTKKLFRNDNQINHIHNKIVTEINGEKIVILFDIKNKEIQNNFYIKLNEKSFYNIFKQYIINNNHNLELSNNLSRN